VPTIADSITGTRILPRYNRCIPRLSSLNLHPSVRSKLRRRRTSQKSSRSIRSTTRYEIVRQYPSRCALTSISSNAASKNRRKLRLNRTLHRRKPQRWRPLIRPASWILTMITTSQSRRAGMTADQIVDKTSAQKVDMKAPIDHSHARASGVPTIATENRTTVKEVIIVASSSSSSSAGTILSKSHHTNISNRNLMSRVEPRTTICGDIDTYPSADRPPKARAQYFPFSQWDIIDIHELGF